MGTVITLNIDNMPIRQTRQKLLTKYLPNWYSLAFVQTCHNESKSIPAKNDKIGSTIFQ